MTPGADIEHDARLPWGHWMRTVSTPGRDVVIVDEHGHPLDTIHAYGIPAADAGKAAGNVGLSSILRHPLLDHLKMEARAIVSLNSGKPDLGVSIALDVPRVRYAFPPDPSESADAS